MREIMKVLLLVGASVISSAVGTVAAVSYVGKDRGCSSGEASEDVSSEGDNAVFQRIAGRRRLLP